MRAATDQHGGSTNPRQRELSARGRLPFAGPAFCDSSLTPPHAKTQLRALTEEDAMKVRVGLALLVSCMPVGAHSETMVTSHYRASAPHVAAHRTLPMGTRLLVTNPRSGRSAHVVIRDRGPFVRGRSLDISSSVASQLGFGKSGVLSLTTRVVEDW